MPKITWLKTDKPVKPDVLRELFNIYQKAQGMTSADLGQKLGMTAGAIRCKKCAGTDKFTVKDVRDWCGALGITSPEELGKAILYR